MDLDKNPVNQLNLLAAPSLMSQSQFAAFVGKEEKTIRSWVSTSAIPTVKVGGSRLINFERLRKDLLGGKGSFKAGDYEDV